MADPSTKNTAADNSAAGTAASGWRARAEGLRAWIVGHRVATAGIAVGVAICATMLSLVIAWRSKAAEEQMSKPVLLERLFTALDRGLDDEVRQVAEKLRVVGQLTSSETSAAEFALGTVNAREAERLVGENQLDRYRLAARFLDESRDRGFPSGREAEGQWQLGRCYFLSRSYSPAREHLRAALARNPQHRLEIHRMLAEACLSEATPLLEEALTHNAAYLADPRITSSLRETGLLERASILLRLHRMEECRQTLAQIPSDARGQSEAHVMEGQILMQEAAQLAGDTGRTGETGSSPGVIPPSGSPEARTRYQQAIEVFRQAQGIDTIQHHTTRKAMYLIGLCYLALADDQAAVDQLERVHKRYFETAEGFAAGFALAELFGRLGQDAESLELFQRVLALIDNPQTYVNLWLPIIDLESRAVSAYRGFLARNAHQVAVELAIALRQALPRVRVLELEAEARRAWGRHQETLAIERVGTEEEKLHREGREQLRLAGHLFYDLAEARRASREYSDDLWNSGECLLEGQDFEGAVKVLEMFLDDAARTNRPLALLGLGKARLALEQMDQGLAALEDCVRGYPKHAACFSARLVAAQAYAEVGKFEPAAKLLLENLEGDFLTPDSKEWRQSLFELGRLWYQEGRYADAVSRLEEAVERYPEDPQSLEAHYLIAESYRQRVQQLQGDGGASTQALLAGQQRTVIEFLDRALAHYRAVDERFAKRPPGAELTTTEQDLQRNTQFSRGAVLAELGQFQEAIDVYSVATSRYQQSPVVLEAYVQIAECYRRMNQPQEARSTLEQAKVVLQRMDDKTTFGEATNFSREEWAARLDWLSSH